MKKRLKKVKKYWNKPPKNYQVSLREFLDFSVGNGGISFLSVLVSWSTIAINIPMMLTHFELNSGIIFLISIFSSIIALIRAPILSMIIDNSKSSKGKFKPFLIMPSLLTGICFSLIPYIPKAWMANIVCSFSIPKIAILNIEASTINLSLGVISMFLLVQIGSFFHTLLTQAMLGIEQTMSCVSQERVNIGAYKGFISNIPASVINVIMPIVASLLFSAGTQGGMNNIWVYRIFFPICAVGGFILVFFTYNGVQERVIVNDEYVAKAKFFESAKILLSNKYFWILTIFTITLGIRAQANIHLWVCNYAIGGKLGDTMLAVCNVVLNSAMILPMLFAPSLIKKFGKRNCLLLSNIFFAGAVVLQLFLTNQPYLILCCIFLQNFCTAFSFISATMVSDVLDYIQWKNSKRLEGFWQNFTMFISTLIGFFTGMLAPIFLSFGGIGFSDDIHIALQNPTLMEGAFRNITLLALIGAVVASVPMLFYDLTEDKHKNYVLVLKLRAATDNFKMGKLEYKQAVESMNIIEDATNTKNDFVLNELDSYAFINSFKAKCKELIDNKED